MNSRTARGKSDTEPGLSFNADEAEVVQSVISFIQSATYDEKRRLINQHPELLKPKADEIMARIVEVHHRHGSEQDAHGVQAWREFLADARKRNFNYALARSRMNRIFVGMPDRPAEWNAYLRSVARSEDALRSKEGDLALAEFIKRLEGDGLSDAASAFQGLRSLLKQSPKP